MNEKSQMQHVFREYLKIISKRTLNIFKILTKAKIISLIYLANGLRASRG